MSPAARCAIAWLWVTALRYVVNAESGFRGARPVKCGRRCDCASNACAVNDALRLLKSRNLVSVNVKGGLAVPFARCVWGGCFAEFDLKDDALKKLRAPRAALANCPSPMRAGLCDGAAVVQRLRPGF